MDPYWEPGAEQLHAANVLGGVHLKGRLILKAPGETALVSNSSWPVPNKPHLNNIPYPKVSIDPMPMSMWTYCFSNWNHQASQRSSLLILEDYVALFYFGLQVRLILGSSAILFMWSQQLLQVIYALAPNPWPFSLEANASHRIVY